MSFSFSDPLILTILVAGLVGVAVLVAAFAVFGQGLSDSERMQRRLDNLTTAKPGEAPLKGAAARARDRERDRRQAVEESLKELEQKQKEQRAKLTLRTPYRAGGLGFLTAHLLYRVCRAWPHRRPAGPRLRNEAMDCRAHCCLRPGLVCRAGCLASCAPTA